MSNQSTPPFDAATGDHPYIFISYAHRDASRVYPELERLNREGYAIWYDEGIDPGNEWPQEIAKALDGCQLFICFISGNSANSNNCRNEINYALNQNKQFLAIYLEETDLPGGLALRMGDLQAIMKHRMAEESYHRKVEKVLSGYLPKEIESDHIQIKENTVASAPQGGPPPLEKTAPSTDLPQMELDSEDVSKVIALALKLKDQNRGKIDENELEEVCKEMDVSRKELQDALSHLESRRKQKQLISVVALALVSLLCLFGYSSWKNRPELTETQTSLIEENMGKKEDDLPKPQGRITITKEKLTMAVLPFQNQSGQKELDGLAASCGDAMMIPLSSRSRITLIERMQLNKVIGEIDFNQTKYIDPEHAVELGKVINADYVIVGSLQLAGETIRIAARMVAVEDGGVVYQERVEGPKNKIFELQDALANSLASKI